MKTIIIQKHIPNYRYVFFELLSKRVDLTVIHSDPTFNEKDVGFKVKFIPIKSFLFLEIQYGLLKFISIEKPNYLVVMMDLHFLHVLLLGIVNVLRLKIIWWGPWITNFNLSNRIRLYFMSKYPSILYSERHKTEFVNKNIDPNKLFVSNNTIGVSTRAKSFKYNTKDTILFIGSLNERKGLIETLKIFKNIINCIPKKIIFTIIGDGEMKHKIEHFIKINPVLKTRVFLKEKITNSEQLNIFFNRSLISISMNQAGLSVLHSFANGVPFLTLENSISGGEKWNIINNINGYLCANNTEFKDKLSYYVNNPQICIQMGENAYKYYNTKATPELMVTNFLKSFQYFDNVNS
jgi:glycosyltransferase involved in cell wall biosynthesis